MVVKFKDGKTVSRNVAEFPARSELFIQYFASTFDIPPEALSEEDRKRIRAALKVLTQGGKEVTIELDFSRENISGRCNSLTELFSHYLSKTDSTFYWINYATWKDFMEKIRVFFFQVPPPRGFKHLIVADPVLIKTYELTASSGANPKIDPSDVYRNVLGPVSKAKDTVFILEDPDITLETNDNFRGDDPNFNWPKSTLKNILDGNELKKNNSILIIAAGATDEISIPKQYRGYWVTFRDASKDFPVLESLGDDLTAKAKAGGLKPILGREKEIDELIVSLTKENYNNAFLVGRAGVGKTAIVKGLALSIAQNRVTDKLKDVHIFDIPFSNIIKDTSLGGSLEAKISNLRDEVKAHKKQVIVFFDEFHQVMSNDTIRNVLKPVLSDGDFPCVGATTEEEYQQYIAGNDPAFEQRFSKINIDELPIDVIKKIMKQQITQKDTNIDIKDNEIDYFYWCAKMLDPFKALPRSGEKILGDILEELPKGATITKETIKKHFAVGKICLRLSQEQEFAKIKSNLLQVIKGQESQIERILTKIRSHFFLLTKIEKPLVMLFMGPTGTGKTELAMRLAKELWNDESRYLLSNMGSIDHKTNIIGAPPGYIGYEHGSPILNFLSTKDSGVIILDEIEKIGQNKHIADVFLEIFDKGTTTDNRGRKLNCRPFVFVLTANLGQDLTPEADHAAKTDVLREQGGFRPEFIGRIQLIEVFGRISKPDAVNIIKEHISDLSSATDFDCQIAIDSAAIEQILADADFHNYGARLLKAKTIEIFNDIVVHNQDKIYRNMKYVIKIDNGKYCLSE